MYEGIIHKGTPKCHTAIWGEIGVDKRMTSRRPDSKSPPGQTQSAPWESYTWKSLQLCALTPCTDASFNAFCI
jgi:hypothetical protein